MEISADEAVAH